MRYTDLVLKDFPIALWPLDETISGTSNTPCYSVTDFSSSMNGQYVYNSSWKVDNKSIPLVFGGDKSTFLIENGGSHSLSVPRLNCFSATSIYTDSTLEFWLKIDNSTEQEVKILGIDDSGLTQFGLYAYKNYLVFKVTDEIFIPAPIQTWNIQHHIAIVYSFSGISMIVDGVKYFANDRVTGIINFENNKNFLFYGNSSLGSVQIDSIAIYKYGLTEENCKRHMIYALGPNFSGAAFTRNNGIFTTFENINNKKINELIIPASPEVNNFDSNNLVIGNNGIQLSSFDKIYYYKNNNNSSDFYFTNQSSLSIENLSSYIQNDFGIAIGITINSSSADHKTILYLDGTEDSGDLEIFYQNNNLFLRIYSLDKILEDNPYYEQNIGTISIGVPTMVAISFDGDEYKVYINDSVQTYSNMYQLYFDSTSTVTLGATPIFQDTIDYELYLDNASIYRITIFKSYDEFSEVINETSGNKSRFDSYYKNITLTYDTRIKLHRTGELSTIVSLDEFGRNIWNGSSNKSLCGQLKIETLYPDITNNEILITVDRYNSPTASTPSSTTILMSQMESLDDINSTLDLTNSWIEITATFDSNDCLYFPPILGQISIISTGSPVSTSLLPENDISLILNDFQGNIKLQAQDSKLILEEFIPSSICLGNNSGIKIYGLPLEMNYQYFNISKENDNESGISTISMFVKRNTISISEEVFSWTAVPGTTLPTSCQVYLDGVFFNTISLTGKTKILWSDIQSEINKWKMLTVVFNSPLIYQNTTKTGPSIFFGESSGDSNISIQHLGMSENSFSSQQVLSLYKDFCGQNRTSADDDQTIFISESSSGVQFYQNNWKRV